MSDKKQQRPPQRQMRKPGLEKDMIPTPERNRSQIGSGRLQDKVALITGGDSGIGRAVGVAFAREGADVGILYLNEHKDAKETQRLIEKEGRRCLVMAGDVSDERFCRDSVDRTFCEFGKLDILVNNAAEQYPQDNLEHITVDQLERTLRTHIFSYYFMTKAALPHLQEGSAIINTSSITAYKDSSQLPDYSSTNGAIIVFTRSLSLALAEKRIRVNAIAPGLIWTPRIPSIFPEDMAASFGSDVPLTRAGQPAEVAPSYVFLASDEASYMNGQVLHSHGGTIVNG
jgi:NAD(P)-dependent dehydrogenase (short-subunit alcohol dehydrogenase family)